MFIFANCHKLNAMMLDGTVENEAREASGAQIAPVSADESAILEEQRRAREGREEARRRADAFAQMVVERVESYVRDLEGNRGLPLYEMIVSAAERPLLTWAMKKCDGNQKAAAKLLGINRNTLHKKLLMHGFLTGN